MAGVTELAVGATVGTWRVQSGEVVQAPAARPRAALKSAFAGRKLAASFSAGSRNNRASHICTAKDRDADEIPVSRPKSRADELREQLNIADQQRTELRRALEELDDEVRKTNTEDEAPKIIINRSPDDKSRTQKRADELRDVADEQGTKLRRDLEDLGDDVRKNTEDTVEDLAAAAGIEINLGDDEEEEMDLKVMRGTVDLGRGQEDVKETVVVTNIPGEPTSRLSLEEPNAVDSADRLSRDVEETVEKAGTSFNKAVRSMVEDARDVVDDPKLKQKARVTDAKLKEGVSDAGELKALLIDTLYGLERGLNASSEIRAEISEIIGQLEASNPSEAPTDQLEQLDGEWKLVYTANSELFPLLVANRLPGFTIGDIKQIINSRALTIVNEVNYSTPIAKNAYSVSADFEIRTGKRVQVRFKRGTFGKPEKRGLVFPRMVSVFGTQVDTGPLQVLASPLEALLDQIINAVAYATPISVPIPSLFGSAPSGWLITTYLDDELRITRGDLGSLFVLVKAGSSLDQ
eukprot:jgi/Chlat1/3731/Chrsp259S03883